MVTFLLAEGDNSALMELTIKSTEPREWLLEPRVRSFVKCGQRQTYLEKIWEDHLRRTREPARRLRCYRMLLGHREVF